MTAVAGAIIAQVALTALSPPSLILAHWTARAFLLFAIVAGCISVYYACSLSRDIGKYYQPETVRDWLTAANTSNIASSEVDKKEGRNASLSSIFVLSAPSTVMSYSILAFVTGLAIYQGFVWTRTLDTDAGKTNSRNVFIAYIASSGFCQLFFASAGIIKTVESLLIHRSSMRRLGKWAQGSGGIVEHYRRDGNEPLQLAPLNRAASANHAAASTHEDIAASHHQGHTMESPCRGLEAALEAAARAHILSAEADRQVAPHYQGSEKVQLSLNDEVRRTPTISTRLSDHPTLEGSKTHVSIPLHEFLFGTGKAPNGLAQPTDQRYGFNQWVYIRSRTGLYANGQTHHRCLV